MATAPASRDAKGASNPIGLENLSPNERYERLKSNSRHDFMMNIIWTVGAVIGGLAITGLCATASAKLITGHSITTQFVGLGSLVITIPVGLGVPLLVGFKVFKSRDWAKYHEMDVLAIKCAELLTKSLDGLSKLDLKKYVRYGILSESERKHLKNTFLKPYLIAMKEVEKGKKLSSEVMKSLMEKETKPISIRNYGPLTHAVEATQSALNIEDLWKAHRNNEFSSLLPNYQVFA